jgi:hypothetical protein
LKLSRPDWNRFFENPTQIIVPAVRKLQKKAFLMAAVSDVPDVTGQE